MAACMHCRPATSRVMLSPELVRLVGGAMLSQLIGKVLEALQSLF